MQRSYLISFNERIGSCTFSPTGVIKCLVRKFDGKLSVKIDGELLQGTDLLSLQMEISKTGRPFIIEEILWDDDSTLGEIYEKVISEAVQQ